MLLKGGTMFEGDSGEGAGSNAGQILAENCCLGIRGSQLFHLSLGVAATLIRHIPSNSYIALFL